MLLAVRVEVVVAVAQTHHTPAGRALLDKVILAQAAGV
jgi:hypothetical protein